MSEHLDDIQTYYFLDQNDEREIKAISHVDCDIIKTTISIVERLGNKVLFDILSKWKLEPDQDILIRLEDYIESDQLEEDMKSKGGDFIEKLLDKMKRSYIQIGDNHLHTDKIFIISKIVGHNGVRNVYSIIINDERYLPDKTSSWYSNLSISFNSEDDRDQELLKIKKLIKTNTMCKFVN